jgi:hypothetical protein
MVLEKGFYCGYPATKVLMAPITGRRHQLRQEKYLDLACVITLKNTVLLGARGQITVYGQRYLYTHRYE